MFDCEDFINFILVVPIPPFNINETRFYALKLLTTLILTFSIVYLTIHITAYLNLINIIASPVQTFGIPFIYSILLLLPTTLLLLVLTTDNRQESKIIRNIIISSFFLLSALLLPFLTSTFTSVTNSSSSSVSCVNIINTTNYFCENLPTSNILTSINSDSIIIFSILIIMFQVFEKKFVKVEQNKLQSLFFLLPIIGIIFVIFSSEFLLLNSPIKNAVAYNDLAIFIIFITFAVYSGLFENDSEKIVVKFTLDPTKKYKVFAGNIYPYKIYDKYVTQIFYVMKGYRYILKDIKPKNKNLPNGKFIF